MCSACIYIQFLVHLAAEAVFRKHAFYSSFHNHFRTATQQVFRSFLFLTTRVTRVVDVLLLLGFVACKDNLVRIDHNHIIAAVYVRGVISFVLTAKNRSNFGGDTSYGLISTVNHIPVVLYGSRVRMLGGEMKFTHDFLF